MSERVWNPDVGDLHKYIEELERKVAALTAENKKLREVVKWHADAGDRMSFDCLAELDG